MKRKNVIRKGEVVRGDLEIFKDAYAILDRIRIRVERGDSVSDLCRALNTIWPKVEVELSSSERVPFKVFLDGLHGRLDDWENSVAGGASRPSLEALREDILPAITACTSAITSARKHLPMRDAPDFSQLEQPVREALEEIGRIAEASKQLDGGKLVRTVEALRAPLQRLGESVREYGKAMRDFTGEGERNI